MLGECVASQSEVIRAIVSGYSPGCGPPHPVVDGLQAELPVGAQQRQHPERRPLDLYSGERSRLSLSHVTCSIPRRAEKTGAHLVGLLAI